MSEMTSTVKQETRRGRGPSAAGLRSRDNRLHLILEPGPTRREYSLDNSGLTQLASELRQSEPHTIAVEQGDAEAIKAAAILARNGLPTALYSGDTPSEQIAKLIHSGELANVPAPLMNTSQLAAALLPEGHHSTQDLAGPVVLSQSHNFLWIGIPKVATRSLLALFIKDPPPGSPVVARTLEGSLDQIAASTRELNLFRFTFVRNPWARVVSCYRNKISRWHDSTQLTVLNDHPRLYTGMRFEEFVDYLANDPGGLDGGANRHWISQHLYVEDAHGNPRVDYVGRLESLAEDFETVCKRIGLPDLELPWKNHSQLGWQLNDESKNEAKRRQENRDYREYFTAETRKLIEYRYARDIELFGYEF